MSMLLALWLTLIASTASSAVVSTPELNHVVKTIHIPPQHTITNWEHSGSHAWHWAETRSQSQRVGYSKHLQYSVISYPITFCSSTLTWQPVVMIMLTAHFLLALTSSDSTHFLLCSPWASEVAVISVKYLLSRSVNVGIIASLSTIWSGHTLLGWCVTMVAAAEKQQNNKNTFNIHA